jgi:TPR repeat protein
MAAFWHRNDNLPFARYLVGLSDAREASKGVKMLERLAERGDVEPQLELGEIYRWGAYASASGDTTIKPNILAATKWLKRAADQGNKRGYDRLWQIYLHKGNVDEAKALHNLSIAAQNGVANAQRFLGICYMQGSILPVPQNYSEGVKWLRKAARSDATDDYEKAALTSTQTELAKAYRDGTGVNADLIKSYIWFSIAARAELAEPTEVG